MITRATCMGDEAGGEVRGEVALPLAAVLQGAPPTSWVSCRSVFMNRSVLARFVGDRAHVFMDAKLSSRAPPPSTIAAVAAETTATKCVHVTSLNGPFPRPSHVGRAPPTPLVCAAAGSMPSPCRALVEAEAEASPSSLSSSLAWAWAMVRAKAAATAALKAPSCCPFPSRSALPEFLLKPPMVTVVLRVTGCACARDTLDVNVSDFMQSSSYFSLSGRWHRSC